MTITRSMTYEATAAALLRLSLVIIFFVFGTSKFTKFEADGIAPLVVNSPLTSWLNIFGTQGASMIVGAAELAFCALLVVGFWRPSSILAIVGAGGSVITYLTTLTFLLTTPEVLAPDGPPVLSLIGGFLFKDIVLLAASLVLLAQGMERRSSERDAHTLPGQYAGRPPAPADD